MVSALPAPDDNTYHNGATDSPAGGGYRRRPRSVPIPTRDEILQMLVQLNSAVIVGSITPKQTTFIQKNLRTILNVQMKRAEGRQEVARLRFHALGRGSVPTHVSPASLHDRGGAKLVFDRMKRQFTQLKSI